MTTLKLAITEFAVPSMKTGSIDDRMQMAQVDPEVGIAVHKKIQALREKEFPNGTSELSISHTVELNSDFSILISGRIDFTWTEDDVYFVEEIKTTHNIRRLSKHLMENPEHPYNLQAKLYGWIIWKTKQITPKIHLFVTNPSLDEELKIPVEWEPEIFEQWVQERATWVHKAWHENKEFKKSRKAIGKSIKFPFKTTRQGQKELLADVEQLANSGGSMLAQAPTGIGKTAAVIVPLLKGALHSGNKLIHVTAKNNQLREAEKLIQKLQKKKSNILGLILTSKPKICIHTEVLCNPDQCPFAKNHYDKVNDHQLIDLLKKEPLLNQQNLQHYGKTYEVCPYELARQVMPWRDLIAGDYHYALSPHANIIELTQLEFLQDQKPNLSIDEAHNLSERALDWYEAQIEPIDENSWPKTPRKWAKLKTRLGLWFERHRERATKAKPIIEIVERVELQTIMDSWTELMGPIFASLGETLDQNPLISAFFNWLQFNTMAQLPERLFFCIRDHHGDKISIKCVNAGPLLMERYTKYHAIVAFSATLKPFSYHKTMCGLNLESTATKEYDSPFSRDHRLLIAIPQISTAWRDRPLQIPRIADVIHRILQTRSGNYIAFFPSFELMNQTVPLLNEPNFEIILQAPKASQHWTRDILYRFKHQRNILLCAVQGGVLSEGVDLPGEQLIGTFIIGPAIPMITPEREKRRSILNDLGEDGYAMTYIHPAMARSIQSAGRVIRTQTDKGLIVLMDPRFLQNPYTESFPKDWIPEGQTSKALASQSILADIQTFWSQFN